MIDISLSQTLRGHQNPIFALSAGLDSSTIYSAGNDKGVVEWDIAEGKFKRILCAVPASVYALHLLKERGILILGLRTGEVWVVDVKQQRLVQKLDTSKSGIFAIQSLVEKNEFIAIGEEGVAYVWSLDKFELLYRFRVSETTVRSMTLYRGGNHIVFGDKNGVVYLYEVSDYKEIIKSTVHSMPVTTLAVDDLYLYSGGRDAKLHQLNLLDLSTKEVVTAHLFTVYAAIPHSSLPLLATVSRDKTIKIWNSTTLGLLKNVSLERGFDSHRLSINAAIWVDNRLITAGDDKEIKVWDIIDHN
ncbi:WD40 repeat domain-containing protein [Sphingobacterium shayense]|uniref:WD40 repeat domain-containing protein n=1 Tax=Sphingobacterium shayense TaxID=626343 RepID=UPI001555BC49|nr:WD40 repeat domain-containing protein [Sphingobacterium shayense]NQD71248.1 WD40 repeat domain-containing protein [Sphingobacterium shayense]